MRELERELRPGEFGRLMLRTIEASEGRRKRRKRDTTPDAIGLNLKLLLLQRAADDDPEPDGFEGWLLGQALTAEASGPVRAVSAEILAEYQFARGDAAFTRWLREGAASADAERGPDEDRWRAGLRVGENPNAR